MTVYLKSIGVGTRLLSSIAEEVTDTKIDHPTMPAAFDERNGVSLDRAVHRCTDASIFPWMF